MIPSLLPGISPRALGNAAGRNREPSSACSSKRTCGEMTSCTEARHYLTDCGLSRLDRDGDGVPCEAVCR
ncbi:excalibur calcium-binding domain-containing protein [Imhoffiella purpurea]|uniref:excalibur calcium-binding domain-containing protein n=1 Tax=Imhoffiella purpurea TaxID=1249627 RepID=UPI002FC2BAB4